MIIVIQRVTHAKVLIGQQPYSSIKNGYMILLGICENDSEKDVDLLTDKVVNLRIMADKRGKMNKSIQEVRGEILLVSQFTLCADTKKGRRPSFINAMNPKEAENLYESFAQKLRGKNLTVQTGKFAAYMEVQIFNDGPVTIIIDSKKV